MVWEVRELDEVGLLQLPIPAEIVYDLNFPQTPDEPLLLRAPQSGSLWARLPAAEPPSSSTPDLHLHNKQQLLLRPGSVAVSRMM